MEFCRDACKEKIVDSSILSWCANNTWVGPETDTIPQPIPEKQRPGHFMDVFQTPTTGTTPDDSLQRK